MRMLDLDEDDVQGTALDVELHMGHTEVILLLKDECRRSQRRRERRGEGARRRRPLSARRWPDCWWRIPPRQTGGCIGSFSDRDDDSDHPEDQDESDHEYDYDDADTIPIRQSRAHGPVGLNAAGLRGDDLGPESPQDQGGVLRGCCTGPGIVRLWAEGDGG